jgi:hypothetical protein
MTPQVWPQVFGVAVGAGAAPAMGLVTTRVAVGVPSVPFIATMMTLSPTAKLPDVSADFFVPNWVALVTLTVTVWPLRVRMVQLSLFMDWIVARKASRLPAAAPRAAAPPAAGAGVAVLVGIDIADEFDDVSDAVTAAPTPQAVRPDTRTTAMTPAATPVAKG